MYWINIYIYIYIYTVYVHASACYNIIFVSVFAWGIGNKDYGLKETTTKLHGTTIYCTQEWANQILIDALMTL